MLIKYTKRFSAAAFALFIALCASFCVFAQANVELIDDADLYTKNEKAELLEELEGINEKTGWVAVINTNYDGYDPDSIQAHSNRYYADRYGKTTSGVMLTIDMSGRAVDFVTKGDAMYYFNDDRVDTILDDVQYSLKYEEYYEAAKYFVDYVNKYYDAGKPDGGTFENVDLQEKEDNPALYIIKHYGIIIFLAGIGIGALCVGFTVLRYKNNGKQDTYNLKENSVTRLTDRQDIFINKSVSVTTVSSSSGSSGGGGRSSSGGGGSRGGGSRGF